MRLPVVFLQRKTANDPVMPLARCGSYAPTDWIQIKVIVKEAALGRESSELRDWSQIFGAFFLPRNEGIYAWADWLRSVNDQMLYRGLATFDWRAMPNGIFVDKRLGCSVL